ncbi:MAG TPA: hypothetical protein VFY28_02180 [Candidatus Paceibacterota bacterium]|nr:hypothetical protein [Candidatus Paceibacterota bacterium]
MLRTIVLIIVIVLVLSFFGISIREIINSPTGQENFGFLWELVKDGWNVLVGLWQSIVDAAADIFKPLSFSR